MACFLCPFILHWNLVPIFFVTCTVLFKSLTLQHFFSPHLPQNFGAVLYVISNNSPEAPTPTFHLGHIFRTHPPLTFDQSRVKLVFVPTCRSMLVHLYTTSHCHQIHWHLLGVKRYYPRRRSLRNLTSEQAGTRYAAQNTAEGQSSFFPPRQNESFIENLTCAHFLPRKMQNAFEVVCL